MFFSNFKIYSCGFLVELLRLSFVHVYCIQVATGHYNNMWLFAGSWLALIIIKRVSSCFMPRLIFNFFCLLFEWATRIPHRDCSKHKLNLGGGSSKAYTFSQISEHLVVVAGTMSDVSQLEEAVFRYVAHVNEVDSFAYPYPQYVCTSIPLDELFSILPVSHARNIASIHGTPVGSRCTASQLMMCIENHSCFRCHSYFTIFSVEIPAKQLTAKHVAKFKENKKSLQLDKKSLRLKGTLPVAPKAPPSVVVYKFPPDPADSNLIHTILTKICDKMQPKKLEEAGCAVCGELKPMQELSRLKGIKNLLSVLEAPGITRTERKKSESPIKEYGGPVLDYSCSRVCEGCRRMIRKGKVPRLALANNLWIGRVPEELKNLRYVEKILVSRVRHTCAYVKVASGMHKMKANVVAFESPIPKIYAILPPPREDLDEVLAILFTGPSKPTPQDFARTPFLVRRNAVIKALEWLKLNHADYADIEISKENIDQYQEDMPLVSIEYCQSETNKVPEGMSVFDQGDEEGTEQGSCAFTVHGLTGEALQTMSPNALKAIALQHLNNNGKMLAVGHSDKLQSIWNNPQLYPQMFPCLFPYGLGGIGASTISHKEHKRHLLMYHDKHFQIDVNFPFVAFSHEQMKINTTQSFLLVDQHRFGDISQRLMNLDQNMLDDLTK